MQNAIDFSKVKRIEPRSDSWDKVCARLDSMQAPVARKTKFFPLYAALPLAASFLLVGFSLFLMTLKHTDALYMPLENSTTSEISTWYNSLGTEVSDDLETLDESETISYLFKETK
ncbi:MAG: hypothetical protein MJY99_01175 [Fibrobacter sp.]|uniref:hypothetical protein n=1 Tax=Fibrobacter sp. TaxID=35828 RepID=UPI00388F0EF9|nr:hypothetical protein [Fibrobacter sp.]